MHTTSCNFQCVSNSVSSDPTFWFQCISVSWQCVLTTGHCICEIREFFGFFVMGCCPFSTAFGNPASTHNELYSCDNISIRLLHCCNRRSWRAKSSQSEIIFVLITLDTNEDLGCLCTTPWPVREMFRTLHTFVRLFCED